MVRGVRSVGASLAVVLQEVQRAVLFAFRLVVPRAIPAARRRANSAQLRDARIRALEEIGRDVHRAETIREEGPTQGAARAAAALQRNGPGRERTGRRALVRGLLGEISALLPHHAGIGHRVTGSR